MIDNKKLPRGVITALVTPMKGGSIDHASLCRLIERQITAKISALVVCGTTGEAPTLSRDERRKLLRTTRDAVGGRIPLIMGSGSNDTSLAVEYAKEAADGGADALLVVTPYYNKGTEGGVIRHYLKIADATSLPLIIYNVPSRTGTDLPLSSCEVLSEHENIAGIKEAGSFDKIASEVASLRSRMKIYSGNDQYFLPSLSVGADGVISVASNILPENMVRIFEKFESGDIRGAIRENMRLLQLYRLLFAETNPAPIKCACELLGICNDELRLPLSQVTPGLREGIERELKAIGDSTEA